MSTVSEKGRVDVSTQHIETKPEKTKKKTPAAVTATFEEIETQSFQKKVPINIRAKKFIQRSKKIALNGIKAFSKGCVKAFHAVTFHGFVGKKMQQKQVAPLAATKARVPQIVDELKQAKEMVSKGFEALSDEERGKLFDLYGRASLEMKRAESKGLFTEERKILKALVDVTVGTTKDDIQAKLISSYLKTGHYEKAKKLFQSLDEAQVLSTPRGYELTLLMYEQAMSIVDLEGAKWCLDSMKRINPENQDLPIIQQDLDRKSQIVAKLKTVSPDDHLRGGLTKGQMEVLENIGRLARNEIPMEEITKAAQEIEVFSGLVFTDKELGKNLRRLTLSYEKYGSKTEGFARIAEKLFMVSGEVSKVSGKQKSAASLMKKSDYQENHEQIERVAQFAHLFSKVVYKMQPENIQKSMQAMEKLASIMDKIERKKDLEALERVVKASEELYPEHKSHYEAYEKVMKVIPTDITEDEKLTPKELMLIHSFLNLKNDLKEMVQHNFTKNSPFIAGLVTCGDIADENAKKLMELLSPTYDSGCITLRNVRKFNQTTGKSHGPFMDLFHRYFIPHGHGALIDLSMDMHTLMFSHVLGEYRYNPVDLQEFFTQDVYRLNLGNLIANEGNEYLARWYANKKEKKGISPLNSFDTYLNEMWAEKIEEVLAGSDFLSEVDELTPGIQLAEEQQRRMKEFGDIHNKTLMQILSIRSPIHTKLSRFIPLLKAKGIDFGTDRIEGEMICTAFQARIMMKALALCKKDLEEKMVKQIMKEKNISKEEAEKMVEKLNPIKMPISPYEDFSKMHPKRLLKCFSMCLESVPFPSVATEVIKADPKFFEPVVTKNLKAGK